MPFEALTGLGVSNQYGTRETGGSNGKINDDVIQYLAFDMTGASLNSTFNPPVYMPKGGKVLRAFLRVDEAFAVSTGPVNVGGTAPATNGVILTKTQLEAIGTKDVSSVAIGTWATASATGPTATEKVTKTFSGTVTTGVGKGTLIVEYLAKTKV